MDDQRTDRKGSRVKRVARSLLLSILAGAFVFGVLFGVEGTHYAINAGPEIHNKSGPPYTVTEWIARQLFGGMILGGLIGVVGWLILITFDALKKLFPTH